MKRRWRAARYLQEICAVARRRLSGHDAARSRCSTAWETLYPLHLPYLGESHSSDPYDAMSSHVHQYVRIDLRTGSIRSLTDAPLADEGVGGWTVVPVGRATVAKVSCQIPSSNRKRTHRRVPAWPLWKYPLAQHMRGNVKGPKTETIEEEGYHLINGARFAGGTNHVIVAFISHQDQSLRTTEYQRRNDSWRVVRELKGSFPAEQNGLEVSVKQGLNEPPLLVAANKQTSRIIWDPNPQLKNYRTGSGQRLHMERQRRTGMERRAVQAT